MRRVFLIALLAYSAEGVVLAGCRRQPVPQQNRVSVLVALLGVPRTINPLYDNVVIDMQTQPSQSTGGIFLPTTFRSGDQMTEGDNMFVAPEPRKGKVLAVGPGVKTTDGSTVRVELTIGQDVIVGSRGGIKLVEEGKTVSDSSLYVFKVP
jgi:co-chaperonin GroES (HSP10)